jgi:hypothetical protein
VRAELSGFPPAEAPDVAAGTLDLRIPIAAGAVLSGKVVRASGATGPYTIWAQPARTAAPALDRPLHPVADRWVDAADGTFELADLPPGRYDLVALGVDGASGSLPGIAVRAGEKRQGLRLELGAGAAITGRLVDLDSRAPLPGAPVHATVEGRTIEGTTDGKGTFRLEGLARGVPGDLRVGPEERRRDPGDRRPQRHQCRYGGGGDPGGGSTGDASLGRRAFGRPASAAGADRSDVTTELPGPPCSAIR